MDMVTILKLWWPFDRSARKWISVMGPNGLKISARYLNALLVYLAVMFECVTTVQEPLLYMYVLLVLCIYGNQDLDLAIGGPCRQGLDLHVRYLGTVNKTHANEISTHNPGARTVVLAGHKTPGYTTETTPKRQNYKFEFDVDVDGAPPHLFHSNRSRHAIMRMQSSQ